MNNSSRLTANNDEHPLATLDEMQILESNSTLTEGTGTDSTPVKLSPMSPSTANNTSGPTIQPSFSYVSSASSTTGVPSPFSSQPTQSKEALEPRQLQYPPSPKPQVQMTTIENSSPRNLTSIARKDSDDAILTIPPVHAFFKQHPGGMVHYDSDGSDGSFVQKGRQSSTDSLTSTGSVKYTSTAVPSPVRQHQNPQMLPYHERRKLMQQRQLQRNMNMSQQPNQLYPSSPVPVDPRLMTPDLNAPYPQHHQPHPQSHPQSHPQPHPFPPMDAATAAAYMNLYGIPPPPYPPIGYHPYGYPPQGHPGYPQNGPLPQQLYGYAHQQYSMPQPPPPPDIKPTPANMQPRLSPYRTINKQPLPAQEGNRPPKAKSLAPTGNITSQQSPRPPATRKQHSTPTVSNDNSVGISTDLRPPPPPPPPPHMHSDSLGSISSFGSTNGRSLEHSGHRRDNSSGSFLEILREQWTPPQQSKPSVSEFHRRNQEFLSRTPTSRRSSSQPIQHRRLASEDRPPASRGTHKRLPSINNDDWDETPSGEASGYSSSSDKEKKQSHKTLRQQQKHQQHEKQCDQQQQIQHVYLPHGNRYHHDRDKDTNERTSLLPPPGISSNEQDGVLRSSNRREGRGGEKKLESTERWDHRSTSNQQQSRKQRKKKHKRKHKSSRRLQQEIGDSEDSSESGSNHDYRQWTQKRARMLEMERAKLIAQWKAEAREEAELNRQDIEQNQWHRKIGRAFDIWHEKYSKRLYRVIIGVETFVANLPLMIGAVAMAVVTLGVVWFKFAEENLESCEPVHFHSSQCTFPEFPGCFYCDTKAPMYRLALGFHFGCNILAGILSMLFVLKVLFVTRVVVDELSSPTTASPAGLLCMTTVCVFAGRGMIGQFMVTTAASIHMCLVFWFVYMALAYRIMPDPSWFPNTVGIGLSAVKTWLYYPMPGHFLMAVSLTANFFFFPISLIRVAVNEKISATVGWMQMSAPAISLYALTIMAQPSFAEEHPDITRFQRIHRMIYLPCMHIMAALSILGFMASCHSLWRRWDDFKKREFSPAHAAFCFPVLSHANALQAYRGSIISFSDIHPRSWRMSVLYAYWFLVLLGGTVATLWITAQFLYCLPRWTNLDLTDEEEPPAPNETIFAIRDMVTAGEAMRQPFVSPAVLQANETGALVLARNGPEGELQYVRTRRLLSLGFEPTMNWSEMQEEREVLLDWVVKNPPRLRHRTLSVPGLDFSYGNSLGTGNSGVYGSIHWSGPRRRADTGPRPAYL